MTYPPDDKEFVPPEWMQLPNDIQLPSSIRMHNLIEKTALFISKHGSQMEILVKAKQAKNPQFDFLLYDSPLNKYYKYLVNSMKSGDYVSSLERPTDSGGSDDEDHYLHPSLLGSASKVNKSPEKLFLPQLPGVPDENSSYSQLVKSLKDKIIREPEKKPEDQQSNRRSNNSSGSNNAKNLDIVESHQSSASESSNSKSESISILPSPPPEVQLYIDKLAEYVARKGEDFEKTIRKRNEARFEFLNPGNIYHCHYIKRKLQFLDEKRQAQAEDIMLKTSSAIVSDESAKGPVSFSLPSRENKKTVSVNDDGNPDQLDNRKENSRQHDSDSDLEEQIYSESTQNSVSKEKQEERRRKAALFLSLLAKKQSEAKQPEASDNSYNKNGNDRNEHQNTDYPSRSPNISPSPTIEAVTSPAFLSKSLVYRSDESSSNSEYSSKHRANSESSKPSSSSLLPFKSSKKKKRDRSSSSSPSSSNCSKHSSHHKPHHHHHHHSPHHHRHHHCHHGHHSPTPPHLHRHHKKHHHHHHHHHHRPRPRHGAKRRSRSRSRSRSHSRSSSRSRSRSPRRKSRKRRCS